MFVGTEQYRFLSQTGLSHLQRSAGLLHARKWLCEVTSRSSPIRNEPMSLANTRTGTLDCCSERSICTRIETFRSASLKSFQSSSRKRYRCLITSTWNQSVPRAVRPNRISTPKHEYVCPAALLYHYTD